MEQTYPKSHTCAHSHLVSSSHKPMHVPGISCLEPWVHAGPQHSLASTQKFLMSLVTSPFDWSYFCFCFVFFPELWILQGQDSRLSQCVHHRAGCILLMLHNVFKWMQRHRMTCPGGGKNGHTEWSEQASDICYRRSGFFLPQTPTHLLINTGLQFRTGGCRKSE